MRRLYTKILGLLFLILLASVATMAVVSAKNTNFTAHLNGGQEVPAVNTTAQGQATFKLNAAGTAIEYKVNVAQLENVKFSHLHLAPIGSNGGVVVDLSGAVAGKVNGTLVEGTIKANQLKGALSGQPLSVLIAQMEAGNIYVNVHTNSFPGGEIRGQVK